MKLNVLITLAAVLIALPAFAKAKAKPQPKVVTPPLPGSASESHKMPYVAEITGEGVNVRSGPGMNYYACGKISAPLRVIIVEQKYSWSKILPPPGSFSWIFKQYVKSDPDNPHTGIVTASNVRVYAGSDDRAPIRSDSVQLELKIGTKVQIIGSPSGDYYRIVPPEGACLWTSTQFTKFIRDAKDIELQLPKIELSKTDTGTAKPKMLIEQITAKSRSLEHYYDLVRDFEDEKAKPLSQQDYSQIKASLETLTNDPNSGDAGSYSKYLLKQIARCELSKYSATALQSQKSELEKALAVIEKTRSQSRKNTSSLGRFAVIGVLKTSLVYETKILNKRFLVVDSTGQPICYAEPVGEAAVIDFEPFIDKQIGLTGTIATDSQSNLALVQFEKIEEL